jgi:type I restriction enzyme M protein
MTANEFGKLTTTNIQEKANLIWNIANHLVGLFKPHEYGKVILPMTVLKRFDDALLSTKKEVLELNKKLEASNTIDAIKEGLLCKKTGYDFYNTSPYTYESLLADPDNIISNFDSYLKGFSDNIKDIISNFKFEQTLETMNKGNVLYIVVQEFNSKKADMHPDKITSTDMGYIFEELIRKFSESYDEQAGAHFTSRDIIYLMTELLIANEKEHISQNGVVRTAYDMTMGTSQMLGCLDEKIREINSDSKLSLFGQEFNPETYAIAKADMLIKGGNAQNMKFGDTLNDDKFSGYEFDYIISNPPFGIDWKLEEKKVKEEHSKLGYEGRFGPGLPAISDGQMLFLLNGIKKLKEGTGRMAIIQNGSSLFTGDAGSGPSEIRKYIIENDLLEAIIQLPNDLFYNTGISTYIWVLSKGKSIDRIGKVQLIDASSCYVKRRKSIGKKRVDLDDVSINLITESYTNNKTGLFKNGELKVETKIFNNDFFGYTKVIVESPIIDTNNKLVLKKGKPQADTAKRDSELIPLIEDIDKFFNENVIPYNRNAWMDRTKDKVGYEIPFTRLFYKFIPPKPSNIIFNEIKQLEEEERKLMKELFGE